ncbi:Transmembrane protease serine 9-like protein, partial [Dinothrombium tinctorium]
CGAENIFRARPRIIGGSEIQPENRYPWLAVIERLNEVDPICGGALIDHVFLLTAAHCVNDYDTSSVRVILGAHSLKNAPSPLRVARIIVHDEYLRWNVTNDIALLELASPVHFSEKISPICLPSENNDEFGMLRIAGWGANQSYGFASDIPKHARIPLFDRKRCAEIYGELSTKIKINENLICAGGSGSDTCQGDSGGPLFSGENNFITLIGISSYGIGCGREGIPGVYTRVSKYISWIYRKTGGSFICQPKQGPKPVYPNFDDCGIPNESGLRRVKRIVNGAETRPLEFPWMAIVAYDRQLIAGAVLISKPNSVQQFVITAASAISSTSLLKVVLGVHDISAREETKFSCKVKRIYFHSDYTGGYDYDFAILELNCANQEQKLASLRPICLPTSNMLFSYRTRLTIAGWGRTSTGDDCFILN